MLLGQRSFSTAEKVYPSYLPHLHQTKRMPFKWFKPLAALLTAGVAFRLYATNDGPRDRSRLAEAAADQRYDAERQRQNALMDEYGARDSLEELEKAVAFYQKRQ